ncbi:MAG TPA: hypothetical protein VH599_10660 [Ktedonobacterales bacterium]|jgi:hypothetical protein
MWAFPDRFWWAQRVWGVLVVLGALGSLVWLVIKVLGLFNFAGFGTGWQISIPLLVIAVLFVVALVVGVLPLLGMFAQGIGYLWGSSLGRDRFHRRLLAIQGNQEAMPRATIKVDPGNAPRLSGGSLELLWRGTGSSRLIWIIIYLVFVPIFAAWAGLGIYTAYALITSNPAQLSLLVRGGLLALVVSLLIGAPLLFTGMFVFFLPRILGKPYGVIADAAGILYRPEHIGRRRLLRWEEVCLFEVEPKEDAVAFRLYGRDAIVWWRNQPPSKTISLGLTREEFEQRHQALLDLIVARTGLLPRTFDEKLKLADASSGV